MRVSGSTITRQHILDIINMTNEELLSKEYTENTTQDIIRTANLILNSADNKIVCNYGLFGKVPHTEILNPKRIKANEIESRIKAKRKEGYKEAIELKDNAPMEIVKSSLASFLDMYLPKNNTTQDGFVLPMLAKVLKDNKPFTKSDYIGQYKINGLRCIIGAGIFNLDPNSL